MKIRYRSRGTRGSGRGKGKGNKRGSNQQVNVMQRQEQRVRFADSVECVDKSGIGCNINNNSIQAIIILKVSLSL